MSKSTGLQRHTIDKYYTSQAAVDKCIALVKQHVNIKDDDMCIEPSAGDGAFITAIKSLFKKYKFYDLKPDHCEIVQQDYLEYTFIKPDDVDKVHIIGNPPFGRQSTLAIKFIKKSTEYCDSISFILPKSFKKNSLRKHFDLHFHLVVEYDLPENSFIVDKKSHDVPCVFQIWVKKDTCREKPEILAPLHYNFVKKEEQPDISFRRVGINAGHIDTDTENKSTQSHYFIKFDVPLTTEMMKKLAEIVYDNRDNTCGPRSISKQELIKEFNKLLVVE